MTEYYEIVDFEKLTYADFFKRYFPEMCEEDSFDDDGMINNNYYDDYFVFICDIRNYVLHECGFLKEATSIRERGADPRYIRKNKKRMTKLLSQKSWEKFPFGFVTPFEDEDECVIIGTLKEKKTFNHIIVGNTIFCSTD